MLRIPIFLNFHGSKLIRCCKLKEYCSRNLFDTFERSFSTSLDRQQFSGFRSSSSIRHNVSRQNFGYHHHNEENNRRGDRKRFSNPGILFATSIISTARYYLGLDRPKLDDDEIKDKIKYAIWCVREKKYDEALTVMHEALFQAEARKDDTAINYCMDLMANVYNYTGRYDEAERLFATLIQRLTAKKDPADGNAANSPAIVELSLKLANIYAIKGEDAKAEAGFEFCIEAQRKMLEKSLGEHHSFNRPVLDGPHRHDSSADPESSDPFALYGLVLETYSRYLINKGRVDDSIIYIGRALEMAVEVHGPVHSHTVTLLNNFAISCMAQMRYDVAERFLKDAVQRAILIDSLANDLPGYYTNYAEALWHVGKHEEALDYARRAAKLASNKDFPLNMRQPIEEYVRHLESDYRTQQKKKAKK